MKVRIFLTVLLSLVLILSVELCAQETVQNKQELEQIRQVIGQKLILDIRYFCPNKTRSCQDFQSQLSSELTDLIVTTKPSGLIFFAENVVSSERLLTLNYDLQKLAKDIGLPPLFIAVDQEGGRVSRLINGDFPVFSGNMAIGATYRTNQQSFATAVGAAMGEQLSLLGINLNFAPSVDVNSNPNNPIINVRSFSQNPHTVAMLGGAFMDGLQQQNVIGALKHFPGHGDTAVDSHVGLPSVNHTRSQIDEIDLYPFKKIIETQQSKGPKRAVSMIMTAHIQYPKLDDTSLLNKFGAEIVVPATLSKKILGEVLRDDLKFAGVIISDAMDMAGISQFFDQQTAVKQSFLAGVDIALMPYSLKTQADMAALNNIIQVLAEDAASDPVFDNILQKSAGRVANLKSIFRLNSILDESLNTRLTAMRNYISQQPHQSLARTLAQSSVTEIKNNISAAQINSVTQVLAVMPDKLRCEGLQQALANVKATFTKAAPTLHCYSLLSDDLGELVAHFSNTKQLGNLPSGDTTIEQGRLKENRKREMPSAGYSLFMLGDITPNLAFYETKGAEGIKWSARLDAAAQLGHVKQLEAIFSKAAWPSVFVAMRSPYVVDKQTSYNAIYATYDYQVLPPSHHSNAFDALIAVILLNKTAEGSLPVEVDL